MRKYGMKGALLWGLAAGCGSTPLDSGEDETCDRRCGEGERCVEATCVPEEDDEEEEEEDTDTDDEEEELHALTEAALQDFYAGHDEGREGLPELFVEALEAALYTEDLVVSGEYEQARDRLDALFARFPLSTDAWDAPLTADGAFIGSPPAYYALRMLDEIVESDPHLWTEEPHMLRMRVVLAQCAEGSQPIDLALEPPGVPVELTLAPEVRADDYRVLRQSLQLFQLYVRGITDGRLAVELSFDEVEDCVDVAFNQAEYAGIVNAHDVIEQLPQDQIRSADMFWVLYPSNVPTGAPFETQHFITGGMGSWGLSPVFIIDDQWVLRHAPHHTQGAMHDVERRTYLPQWLQHEFFHHLFRTWPEFGLEAASHQWFQYPQAWPIDFVGSPYTVEPDYFSEAITKRLRGADPPLHFGLRTRPPSDALLSTLTLDDFVGSYQRFPVQNDWHEVTVELGSGSNDLVWRNAAEFEWGLTWQGLELITGPECPYGVRTVGPVLARDADGEYLQEIVGLVFLDEEYTAQP